MCLKEIELPDGNMLTILGNGQKIEHLMRMRFLAL